MPRRNFTPPEKLTSRELSNSVLASWFNGRHAGSVSFLLPEHFPLLRDQEVWRAMLALEQQGIIGDFTSVVEHLKRTVTVDNTDWRDYCWNIITEPQYVGSLSFEVNAHTIYENALRIIAYRKGLEQAEQALDLTRPFEGAEPEQREQQRVWTVKQLLEAQFPAPRGPWPGVIPVGLTVIGARPKYGKSLLMLQVSGAVGSGGMLFDQKVEKRAVGYYALEDNPRRLQQRLVRLGVPLTTDVDFVCTIKPLHLGGLESIDAASKDYGMIIIDTITRAVPGMDFNRESALYGDLFGRMQTIALNRDISIVSVVHTRKPTNGMDRDPVDDVLGTTLMTAAADCVLAIYRQGGQSMLKGRARDMEDIDLTMQFDPSTVCWQMARPTALVEQQDQEAAILEALREVGQATAEDIATAVEKDSRNTRRHLLQMFEQGKITRNRLGNKYFYFVAGDDSPESHPTNPSDDSPDLHPDDLGDDSEE